MRSKDFKNLTQLCLGLKSRTIAAQVLRFKMTQYMRERERVHVYLVHFEHDFIYLAGRQVEFHYGNCIIFDKPLQQRSFTRPINWKV